MNLLIALSLSILPSVTPSLEAVGYVRLKSQYDRYAEHRRGKRQNNCFEIARTHKRDEQEGYKEYERRSEVAHERQKSYTDYREDDELNQVPLGLQDIERACANRYVNYLYKLGRLN